MRMQHTDGAGPCRQYRAMLKRQPLRQSQTPAV